MRWFVGEDTASSNEIDGELGVDLKSEEQTEPLSDKIEASTPG